MKKIFLIILLLTTSLAFAKEQAAPTATPAAEAFYTGLGFTVDVPAANWDPSYAAGYGFDLLAGYRFDKSWSAQIALEPVNFSGSITSLYNFRALLEEKYTFAMAGWQPYVLAGVGTVFQGLASTGASTVNFDEVAGLGAQFDLGNDFHLYTQVEYNWIFSQNSNLSDFPMTAGVWTGL